MNQCASRMKQTLLLICIATCILCSSCITNKDVVYLQEKEGENNDSLHMQVLAKPYRLQVNDILSINVKALDKELVEIFNPTADEMGTSQQSLYYNGFTVDLHGNIEFSHYIIRYY